MPNGHTELVSPQQQQNQKASPDPPLLLRRTHCLNCLSIHCLQHPVTSNPTASLVLDPSLVASIANSPPHGSRKFGWFLPHAHKHKAPPAVQVCHSHLPPRLFPTPQVPRLERVCNSLSTQPQSISTNLFLCLSLYS